MIKTAIKALAKQISCHSHVNWTLADQAVVSASNFFTALVVARYLGLEAFGVFSVAWLALLFVQGFQAALILTPMLSIGPKMSPESCADYYASVQPLQIGFALFSAVLAGGVIAVAGAYLGIGDSGPELALPLALTVATSQMHEFFRRYSFARGFPSKALRIDLVRYSLQFAALLFLFKYDEGVSIHDTLLVIGSSAIFGLLILANSFPSLAWQRTQIDNTLARHWKMSKWLVPSVLMQWTSGNFFTLAAGAMLGPTAVGAMRAAHNLVGVINTFFQSLDNWAQVRASRIHEKHGFATLQIFSRKLLMISAGITILAVFVLVLWSEFWLELFYGEQYVPYAWLMVGYGVAYIVMSLNTVLRYYFVAIESTRSIFFSYTFASLLSIAAFYPLIKVWGLSGALVGFVMSPVGFLFAMLSVGGWRVIVK